MTSRAEAVIKAPDVSASLCGVTGWRRYALRFYV